MNLSGKTILLTGGTGSLGTKFTEIALKEENPKAIRIFSRGEVKQRTMRKLFNGDPRLHFFIGDVRDRERLYRAMVGVDIVVHTAALKRVDTCESNPIEAIRTNIEGAVNVIDAAIDRKVKKVMAISTDKACLDWHAPVELASGQTISIRNLVVGKGTANVRTLINNGFGEGKINGWYKNQLNGRGMIKIISETAVGNPKGNRGLTLTKDHLVLTPDGWVVAGKLKNGDLISTSEPMPNDKQMALFIGMILGDGHIGRLQFRGNGKTNPKTYFSVGHSEKQLDWLIIKYNALKDFTTNPPHLERPGNRGGEKRTPFWIVRFRATSFFRDMRKLFYGGKKKRVIRKLIEKYFSPILMASWYMDDGTFIPTGAQKSDSANARLETQGFSENDVYWLSSFLAKKGFSCYSYKHIVDNKEYWQIRMRVDGVRALCRYIGHLVPPQLRYKLLSNSPEYDDNAWKLGKAKPYISRVRIEKISVPKRNVYCIDVEPSHCFCANGFIVHNCHPINLYGATKLVAEKLFIQANSYAGTKRITMSCMRYGNVIGSRGSVIPIFQRQRKEGTITITNKRMTRFWITQEQAVRFIIACIEQMKGGEIFIPKIPSMRILELAKVIAPHARVKIIGIQPGEKINEVLLTEEEARHSREFDEYFIIEPEYLFWRKKSLKGGWRPAEGFRYTSDGNDRWLEKSDFKKILKNPEKEWT